MKKVLITGDSQTAALRQGLSILEQARALPKDLDISIQPLGAGSHLTSPFFKKADGKITILERVYKRRIPVLPMDGDVSMYGFSGNIHTIRVLRDIDWRDYAPSPTAKRENAVSLGFMQKLFEADQRYILAFLDAMKSLGMKVFVIDAPRPFQHHPMFEQCRKDVLMHLDREYRRYILNELAARDIDVIATPDECVDAEGFMLAEFPPRRAGPTSRQ